MLLGTRLVDVDIESLMNRLARARERVEKGVDRLFAVLVRSDGAVVRAIERDDGLAGVIWCSDLASLDLAGIRMEDFGHGLQINVSFLLVDHLLRVVVAREKLFIDLGRN